MPFGGLPDTRLDVGRHVLSPAGLWLTSFSELAQHHGSRTRNALRVFSSSRILSTNAFSMHSGPGYAERLGGARYGLLPRASRLFQ